MSVRTLLFLLLSVVALDNSHAFKWKSLFESMHGQRKVPSQTIARARSASRFSSFLESSALSLYQRQPRLQAVYRSSSGCQQSSSSFVESESAVAFPSLSEIKKVFSKRPKPPKRPPRPKFIPPPGVGPHVWTREDQLIYDRFSSCLDRKDIDPEDLGIRWSLIKYREEILKIIPGLSEPLNLGLAMLLSKSPATTKMIVTQYQTVRNQLRYPKPMRMTADNTPDWQKWRGSTDKQGKWNLPKPWESMKTNDDYLLSSYTLGDIMWDYWCKSSSPCTKDENCLIAHLALLAVVGEQDFNAQTDINGRLNFPPVHSPGGIVGQPYRC